MQLVEIFLHCIINTPAKNCNLPEIQPASLNSGKRMECKIELCAVLEQYNYEIDVCM